MHHTTGWRRYRQDMVTTDDSAPAAVSATPYSNTIVCEGYDGIRLRFLTGADAQAYEMIPYVVERSYTASMEGASARNVMYTSHALCTSLTITGGTLTGVDNGLVSASEFFADTIDDPQAVQSAWADEFFTHTTGSLVAGMMDAYSAAGNDIAEMFIRGITGVYGIHITFTGLSSESANALYKLDKLIL